MMPLLSIEQSFSRMRRDTDTRQAQSCTSAKPFDISQPKAPSFKPKYWDADA